MDLLFKRYADPFSFLDEIIANSRFVEFLTELFTIKREEDSYELWLYKCQDKTYSDFLRTIEPKKEMSKDKALSIIERTKGFVNEGKIKPNESISTHR